MTLTFGECAENHVGNQQLGEIADSGFSVEELCAARDRLMKNGHAAELLDLGERAAVLVVRGGLAAFGVDADAMYDEHDALDVDTKALMYKRVVNKKARHNLCTNRLQINFTTQKRLRQTYKQCTTTLI